MVADVLTLVAGLAILAFAGDRFVLGLSRLATVVRVRPIVVGALVGGLGASLPELMVAGVAAGRGDSGLALGSLVGSNIVNICLALAGAALVAPVRVDSRTLRREVPICVGAVVLFAVLSAGGLSRVEGAVLVAFLALAVVALLTNAGHGTGKDELEMEVKSYFGADGAAGGRVTPGRARELIPPVVSLAGMLVGANLLVRSATDLATRTGTGQGTVGLTLVAIGTSVPVVVVAMQAARRGHHDLVVGNVFGSDLFIALGGGALVALIGGARSAVVGVVPIWSMGLVTLAAWAFLSRGKQLIRPEAVILVSAYAATLVLLGH